MMHRATLIGLLLSTVTTLVEGRPPHPSVDAVAGTGAVKCPIVFDGRISASTKATDFDSTSTSKFNPDYVKGNNLKWSDIIKFPASAGSAHFDNTSSEAFEVTISDQSIFQSQNGFRRAGLQFQGDSNNGSPGTSGVKTIHFSVKWDAQRALNLSHEYLVRFPCRGYRGESGN